MKRKISNVHYCTLNLKSFLQWNSQNKKPLRKKNKLFWRLTAFHHLSLLSCFHNCKCDFKEGCKWLTVNTFIVEPEIDCWGFEIFSANNLKTTMWNKFSILIQMRWQYALCAIYLSNIKPVSIWQILYTITYYLKKNAK